MCSIETHFNMFSIKASQGFIYNPVTCLKKKIRIPNYILSKIVVEVFKLVTNISEELTCLVVCEILIIVAQDITKELKYIVVYAVFFFQFQ